MLITTDFHDVPTTLAKNIRIFVISPKVQGYPQAKFPGMNRH
jgi:carboxymethylenebutenolidase